MKCRKCNIPPREDDGEEDGERPKKKRLIAPEDECALLRQANLLARICVNAGDEYKASLQERADVHVKEIKSFEDVIAKAVADAKEAAGKLSSLYDGDVVIPEAIRPCLRTPLFEFVRERARMSPEVADLVKSVKSATNKCW
jgi:hypothetical protein